LNRHYAPNIKSFFLVIWYDWGALMSGIFTVPFTAGTILFSGYGRGIFGAMAILAFLFTAYRIWADERRQLVFLEEHLAPRLRIEFDPHQPKFLSMNAAGSGFAVLYVRVLARALSTTVQNCRVYLQQVSQLNGERYVMLFDEPLLLPWSYDDPHVVQPRQLNRDVDALLDVGWFGNPEFLLDFGLLNFQTVLPNRLRTILRDQIVPFPERNLKLDLLITGDDSSNATLSLNIHRGQPQWDKPQIGWMNGDEIRRDSNF